MKLHSVTICILLKKPTPLLVFYTFTPKSIIDPVSRKLEYKDACRRTIEILQRTHILRLIAV